MKPDTVPKLVRKLRKLNTTCAVLEMKRDALVAPRKNPFPTPAIEAAQNQLNDYCGEIMRTERRIINALWKEAK